MTATFAAEKGHLARLLTACIRCAYFLSRSDAKLPWPLTSAVLRNERRNEAFFETLSAFNERFAKLQDLLAATMRHTALLLAEPADEFLKVLAYFEKRGVIDSAERWQLLRLARNQAAHEYDIDSEALAEHFNLLHELTAELLIATLRLMTLCRDRLAILPGEEDFAAELARIGAVLDVSHSATK
ncbi:MAG: hypothetical protein ACK4Q4_04550 [Rhodocyclaceae bacterium]